MIHQLTPNNTLRPRVAGPEERSRPSGWVGRSRLRSPAQPRADGRRCVGGRRTTRPTVLSLFGAAGALLLAATALAGLPQPMCIYYGQALDGYGWPYTTNAQVVLLHGTQEIARHRIAGSLSPGVNFSLNVHLDDGRGPQPYSQRALRRGDLVSIVVRDQAGQKTIMESAAVPEVGFPGQLILVNVTAGTDADADGLPDTWEQSLVDWSDGLLHGIEDVRPGEDFDGDGQSNLDEYRAGTFAFLDYDLLFGEAVERTASGRFRIALLSVPGKLYGARATTDPGAGLWTPSPVAASDTADFQRAPIEGTGGWLSLYLPGEVAHQFFRPTVESLASYQVAMQPATPTGAASSADRADSSPSLAAALNVAPWLRLRRAGAFLEVSWPAGAEPYTLEHSSDLTDPAGWTTLAAPVASRDGTNVVNLSVTDHQAFFRLAR